MHVSNSYIGKSWLRQNDIKIAPSKHCYTNDLAMI